MCDKQPADCNQLQAGQCSGFVTNYCPVLCGACGIPTSCPVRVCQNGGLWFDETCECVCLPAYTGATCET